MYRLLTYYFLSVSVFTINHLDIIRLNLFQTKETGVPTQLLFVVLLCIVLCFGFGRLNPIREDSRSAVGHTMGVFCVDICVIQRFALLNLFSINEGFRTVSQYLHRQILNSCPTSNFINCRWKVPSVLGNYLLDIRLVVSKHFLNMLQYHYRYQPIFFLDVKLTNLRHFSLPSACCFCCHLTD